jgi:hypothetical protein
MLFKIDQTKKTEHTFLYGVTNNPYMRERFSNYYNNNIIRINAFYERGEKSMFCLFCLAKH